MRKPQNRLGWSKNFNSLFYLKLHIKLDPIPTHLFSEAHGIIFMKNDRLLISEYILGVKSPLAQKLKFTGCDMPKSGFNNKILWMISCYFHNIWRNI